MFVRHSTKLAIPVVACILSLVAGGAALARTPGDPVATSPTAPLFSRVLTLELHGFTSTLCPVAVATAEQWGTNAASSSELRHNGFVDGLREPLRSTSSAAVAYSSVAQFDSSEGARNELAAGLESMRRSAGALGTFRIPIPGGYGFSRSRHIGVAFTDGRFQYLLELDGVGRAEAAVLRGRLVTAALALYRKAH